MMTKLKLYDQAAFLIIRDLFYIPVIFSSINFCKNNILKLKLILFLVYAYQLALSHLQIPAVGKNQALSVITGEANHEMIALFLDLSDTVIIYKINQISNLAELELLTREFSVRKIC